MTWTVQFDPEAFDAWANQEEKAIAAAATAAMREAGQIALRLGRANIAGEGFSTRWQNALRVKVYPEKDSINPAAWIYHKIPYAGVFERPTEIVGKLWLRLPNMPEKDGRDALTPRRVQARFGSILRPVNVAGKRYLAARVPLSGGEDPRTVQVTPAMLRRAIPRGGRSGARQASGGTRFVSVLLFHGVDRISLQKRFDIAGAAGRASEQLRALYLEKFKGD